MTDDKPAWLTYPLNLDPETQKEIDKWTEKQYKPHDPPPPLDSQNQNTTEKEKALIRRFGTSQDA